MAIAAQLLTICLLGFPQSGVTQGSSHNGQVVVRVHDRVSEELLAQVRVQLMRFPDGIVGEQFSGSSGSVQFSGISVGAYTIRATLQGYEPGEAHVDFRNGDSTLQNVDISLTPRRREESGSPNGTIPAEALKIPKNARTEFEHGSRLLNEKKDFSRSIAAFQRAIELYPRYADAYFLMGTAQMQTSAASDAEASLRKAMVLDGHMIAPYYPLALLLFGQRRYAEEEMLLLEAQKLDPTDWRFPFELARCQAQQGRWESALRYGQEAGASANVPSKIHLLLSDIYANSNRPREAVAELELFAKLDPASSYMGRVREVLPILRQRSAASTLPSSGPR
ncbi:MAG TPA: tetratricopeptide repeat protein [Candidatus Acidoferrum sp.]|nr:tetratricopeptide repeat protein [Candidatus Acidoferrum sp.]